jgi:hypothetical protein
MCGRILRGGVITVLPRSMIFKHNKRMTAA